MKILGSILFYMGVFFANWLIMTGVFARLFDAKTPSAHPDTQKQDEAIRSGMFVAFIVCCIWWGAYFMWIY